MKQNLSRIGTVLIAAVSVISLVMSLYILNKMKKTGFVDTIKLSSEYKMKIELEKYDEAKLMSMKTTIDSLKSLHDVMIKQKTNPKEIKGIELQVMQLSTFLEKEYNRSNKELSEKVWQRLNPEINEYAKKHDIKLLIGANGMGTVLYGNPADDFTEDILQYVNNKYQNGN